MRWMVPLVSFPHRNTVGLLSLADVVEVTIDGKPIVAPSALLHLLSGGLPAFLLGFGGHRGEVQGVSIDKQCKLRSRHADVHRVKNRTSCSQPRSYARDPGPLRDPLAFIPNPCPASSLLTISPLSTHFNPSFPSPIPCTHTYSCCSFICRSLSFLFPHNLITPSKPRCQRIGEL